MSKEYYNRYVNKVMNEVVTEVKQKLMPIQAIPLFIRRRMRHYGLHNKYLPPDFKQFVVDPLPTETETNDIKQVETSAG